MTGLQINKIKDEVARELADYGTEARTTEMNISSASSGSTTNNQPIDRGPIRPLKCPRRSYKHSEQEIERNEQDTMIIHLKNALETAIAEYGQMEPAYRPYIPKQSNSKKLAKTTGIMNEKILPAYLNQANNFTDLHNLIYCSAVTIVRHTGGKLADKSQRNRRPSTPPAWERRLERAIASLRADIGRLHQYLAGKRSKKLERHLERIKKERTKHTDRDPVNKSYEEILDTLKQNLSAKSSRLRRYRESYQRKTQNNLFRSSQKNYYRGLRTVQKEEPANQSSLPSKETIEDFWGGIWSNPVEHNGEALWIKKETERLIQVPEMLPMTITKGMVTEAVNKTANWKATGPDSIHNFWLKKLTCTHEKMTLFFNMFLQNPDTVPRFLTQGITYLLPKRGQTDKPANYRPITCLCTMYKILTSCLATAIYNHLAEHDILAEEQKGCIKGSQGCKEQLIIDSVVLEQAVTKGRNIYTAFIDYRKAFDSVPHSWLMQVLGIYKIDPHIVTLLHHLMSSWNTILQVNCNEASVHTNPIDVRRGIFQGDSLSPLWFCMALNPLSMLLKSTGYGFKIKYKTRVKHLLSHLMYMDDIKLYASTEHQLQQLLRTTNIFSNDIKMTFGLDKCRTLKVEKGKALTSGFEMEGGGYIEAMNGTDTYKYLGLLQAKRICHKEIKAKITTEYYKRLSEILKSKLNGKNTFQAINTYAIPALTFTFGTVKWTTTDLDAIAVKTRVILTKYRAHHPKAAIERICIPRNAGGRGLVDIHRSHMKQIAMLRDHFFTKSTSLHKAVCLADNEYSPLNLQNKDDIHISSQQEYLNQLRTKWSSKALHGRYPAELNHDFVDNEASNKWLTNADMFVETEGFMLAIQDQVIATNNYKRAILKERNVEDICRKCKEPRETIQHITSGCRMLAPTSYLNRHDQVAKIVHQSIAQKYQLIEEQTPYYKYEPAGVIENTTHQLYWNRSVITDKPIPCNRPDIILVDHSSSTTYLIDVAIPNSHNLQTTWNEKINKYVALAEEIKTMWRQKEVFIVPIVISATGLIPKKLKGSLEKIGLSPFLYIKLQKSVILSTCNLTRAFLSLQ